MVQEIRHNPLRPVVASPVSPNANDDDYKSQREKLCTQAVQLAMQEQFDQALQLATQALEIQQAHLGAEQPEALVILETIAVWQDRAANYRAASGSWARLAQVSSKVRGENHWSTVNARLFGEVCEKAAQLSPQDQQR